MSDPYLASKTSLIGLADQTVSTDSDQPSIRAARTLERRAISPEGVQIASVFLVLGAILFAVCIILYLRSKKKASNARLGSNQNNTVESQDDVDAMSMSMSRRSSLRTLVGRSHTPEPARTEDVEIGLSKMEVVEDRQVRAETQIEATPASPLAPPLRGSSFRSALPASPRLGTVAIPHTHEGGAHGHTGYMEHLASLIAGPSNLRRTSDPPSATSEGSRRPWNREDTESIAEPPEVPSKDTVTPPTTPSPPSPPIDIWNSRRPSVTPSLPSYRHSIRSRPSSPSFDEPVPPLPSSNPLPTDGESAARDDAESGNDSDSTWQNDQGPRARLARNSSFISNSSHRTTLPPYRPPSLPSFSDVPPLPAPAPPASTTATSYPPSSSPPAPLIRNDSATNDDGIPGPATAPSAWRGDHKTRSNT